MHAVLPWRNGRLVGRDPWRLLIQPPEEPRLCSGRVRIKKNVNKRVPRAASESAHVCVNLSEPSTACLASCAGFTDTTRRL